MHSDSLNTPSYHGGLQATASKTGVGELVGVRIRAPRKVPLQEPTRGSWQAALLGVGTVAAAGLLAGFYTVVDAAVERGAAQHWQVQQQAREQSQQSRLPDFQQSAIASRRVEAQPVFYSVLR